MTDAPDHPNHLTLAACATRSASGLGKPVAVSVVDPGGHVLVALRSDEVQAAAAEVSLAKARAAALFNRASGDVEQLMSTAGRPALLGLTSVVPGTLGVQGGVPIHRAGSDEAVSDLLGAIGVSGGTPAEDSGIAKAGRRALVAGA